MVFHFIVNTLGIFNFQVEDLPPDETTKLLVVLIIVISFISMLSIIFIVKSKQALQSQIDVIGIQRNEIKEKNKELSLHVENLKELNDDKNNTISIAAHDLRTPLNNIEGLINLILLENDNLTTDQQKYLSIIQETTQNARQMVNNILDIHKIESEYEQMVLTRENIITIVQDAVKFQSLVASQKKLEIHIETSQIQNKEFHTDKSYLKQILSNLLTNAIQYSPEGSRIVILIVEGGNTIKISFVDQGPGMDKELLKRIFTPYSRVTIANSEWVIGLGLTITRKLVEKLNGKLRIESEVGKGSTFTVEFFK